MLYHAQLSKKKMTPGTSQHQGKHLVLVPFDSRNAEWLLGDPEFSWTDKK